MLRTLIALLCLTLQVVIPVSANDINSRSKCPPSRIDIPDPPYHDFFYSDCKTASQVVVTSPEKDSNLSLIGPRLLVAWPAGNSGVVGFFSPANGKNGTLSIKLVKQKNAGYFYLTPIYNNEIAGITGFISLNSSAILNLAILGSVRTIRDFTEGPSILVPSIQNAIKYKKHGDDGAILTREWLDNKTVTNVIFEPIGRSRAVKVKGRKLLFRPGVYRFEASFNYPQLVPLRTSSVFNEASQGLIKQDPDKAKSLAFFSYPEKAVAGGWRFLTYFGRDTLISLLLMQSILSNELIEAIISAALERIQRSTGTVCHEETIGDYATYLHQLDNVTSTKPLCNYVMIDSDFYLPVAINNYFVKTKTGQARSDKFFAQKATTNFGNRGLQYSQLFLANTESIMKHAQKFVNNPVKENLRHLEKDQIVGQWRDSSDGLGYGRIPYDVNTALVPAALRAIASLSRAGLLSEHPEWGTKADQFAKVWEDKTLSLFSVTVPKAKAKELVQNYVQKSDFKGPSQANRITDDVSFYALSLDGGRTQKQKIRVMHTDIAFRLFLLNTTNDEQLTSFMTNCARSILMRFPAGLSSDVGIFVANPAYGLTPAYAKNFTREAYHGTVTWSFMLAMLGKGMEHQLGRCDDGQGGSSTVPAWCQNDNVHSLVTKAYNHLWDVIEANEQQLSGEVWSYRYDESNNKFYVVDLGTLTSTESDVRQLWSLTFLAVKRNPAFR